MNLRDAVAGLSPAAVRLADLMEERAATIGVRVMRLPGGTRVIDAGIDAPGSFAAGRLYAKATMGGLGRIDIATRCIGPAVLPEARVTVEAPLVACLGSQYAGWKVAAGPFFAMGSGPARAVAAAEPLFGRFALRAKPAPTVLLLESDKLPGPEVADLVAGRCGIEQKHLTLVAAPTGSLAGCTQVASRSVETALHKLLELGFDVGCVIAGSGSCPIAPGIPDTLQAIGRTNDAVLYGAEVSLWVLAEDAAIESVLERVPSCASREHGRLFCDLFREHGDFYKIDPLLFSPARVSLVNAATGRVFSAGRLDEPTLLRSFGLAAAE